jgi:hypothetical protein
MPSPKDIKKLMNVAKGAKPASKPDFEAVMANLPKGSPKDQLEAQLMFERLQAEKDAFYAPKAEDKTKGKAALREIKGQLRESGKQKFLEPSKIKQRLYHGTSKDIAEFKPSRIGALGPGVYLSEFPSEASGYAGILNREGELNPNVMPVHVQARNPFVISDVNKSNEELFKYFDPEGKLSDDEVIKRLLEAGYDSIYAQGSGELNMLDPKRIKSAIGNVGTYDIENPDITKAEGGLALAGGGGKLGKALKAARGAEKAVESGKDLQSMVEAARPLTAAERAMAGKLMTEYIAAQPVTRLSEALGNVGAEGKKLRITQSDRTAAKYLGGPPFSGLQLVDPNYAEARATWGVKTPTAAKIITNQTSPDILWSTLIGSPFQHRSNELIFDKLYKAFQKSAKEGNLSEELRAKFNAALEPHFGEGADILDPKLRKEINTFEERGIVGDLLLGKELGGALRGGSIIPGGKIMMESTEPMLQGVKTFSVGPRLFTLDKGVISRPDMHPAFPEIMQGEDLRQLFTPVPNEIALPTFHEEFRRRTGGKKKPGYYELTMTPKGDPYPTQDVTEEYLTHLQREGYADGGGVHMQGGGDPGEVSGEMFKPKPLEIPSIFKDAAAALKAQFQKERRSMRKPGAVQDVIMRGPVAFGMGAPMDIVGMGGELLDYAQTKIPALRKPASVMDTGPEKTPHDGICASSFFGTRRPVWYGSRARATRQGWSDYWRRASAV